MAFGRAPIAVRSGKAGGIELISVTESYVDVAGIRQSARKRRYLGGTWIGRSQSANSSQNQASRHERNNFTVPLLVRWLLLSFLIVCERAHVLIVFLTDTGQ